MDNYWPAGAFSLMIGMLATPCVAQQSVKDYTVRRWTRYKS